MSRRPNHRQTNDAPPPAFKGMFQVGDLANRVISVLRERSIAERALLCDSLIDRLLTAISDPRGFDAEGAIDMLRAAHLSDKDIISCYIPEAARHLGCRWDQSEMSFAQVTTASARLQDMVRVLSSDWSERNAGRSTADQLGVLLVMCENDTHTLGCASIAACLRHEGHSVRLILSATQLDFRKALRQDWYDLIMFSCARVQALETIAEFVTHARTSIRNVPPLILGGLVLTQLVDAKDITGVDLATNDLQFALKLCDTRAVGKKLVAE
ncbi:cobalamin B12-binding domain-containing protein [Seohaeicola sp. SP36]|uniref:cobalamin B12-binding domain-containing protein n=1 Tax=unclassified Seohaeicola TaxID=2641111 RepID=UPI00237A1A1C|nr:MULTISPECIES: cobalamin B12-binding domain-containing protein [unclassified Seohaeicola]MDD9709007.1 cobalamin B12-binding domain-containing protein [Seohaeicola sp. 4SK31]MDD9737093.1 cobalamin B12-binding domain-containing protein [Seohaeicola sp. SP36]